MPTPRAVLATPTGLHDTLTATGSPTITSYDLVTHNQVKDHFTNPNGTKWVCSAISDENGNTITVNHNTSNQVTTIVDPTSRTITLNYTSGKITSINDPLSRTFTIGYNTSGNLNQISYPSVTVSGTPTTYTDQFAYDSSTSDYQDRSELTGCTT